MSFKPHFKRFLEADPERLHFAAHSHHLWPDVSFDAHVEAWMDAARLADNKWDRVFGEMIPRASKHVATRLGLTGELAGGSSIAWAPNTHSLVLRILSCLPADRPLRILTTDAEFHSFARQIARLEEDGLVEVTRVAAEPLATFVDRFAASARAGASGPSSASSASGTAVSAAAASSAGAWDLVYLSHTFFNSGYVVPDLAACIAPVAKDAYVVVDGYHAFGAVPVDISALQDRIFYVAGGYKYAMAGEGACFMHVPAGYGERPRDTGWYAAFGALAHGNEPGKTAYAPGGARFLGATFDPSAIYRVVAVFDWLDREQLTPARLHAHVVHLQELFIEQLGRETLPLRELQLVVPLSEPSRGQFLTFRTAAAADMHQRLLAANVLTDVRGDRLRFGFAVYHDDSDIGRGIGRLCRALG